MWHYIKFSQYFLISLLGIACLLLAEHWIIIGFAVFVSIYVLGDALLGDDMSMPALEQHKLLEAMLYLSVPFSALLILVCLWLVTPQQWAWIEVLSQLIQIDLAANKANTSMLELVFAVFFAGLMLSGIATVVAHELVHKVGNPVAVCVGRWLLSLSFDANFSIEHVYSHHAYVATSKDPVTAPRGRNVYQHIVLASIGTQRSAWQIEKKRLSRKKLPTWHWANKALRGYAMSITWLCIAYITANWQGVLFVTAIGLVAKTILEIVNYMEHYGLVRDLRQPVKPKHSWNSNRKISCWAMFNLPRHSHHHAQGAVPFEKLQAMPDAPLMIGGYITTIGITLIPPLWFKLMQSKLEHWDTHFANEQELAILAEQKRKS